MQVCDTTCHARKDWIIRPDDAILVTGAAGFIGVQVVANLLARGFRNVRCLVRPSSRLDCLRDVLRKFDVPFEKAIIAGNLLVPSDCLAVAKGVRVVLHLAAGRGLKSYADAFLNSVVTTRNLLDACIEHSSLQRFVNVSSFTVYSNKNKRAGRILDESCPVEEAPHLRGEPYCYAKVRQDHMVMEYGWRHSVPFVLIRPGVVYGPGNEGTTPRVGLGTFGLFLHLGGSNQIPFTYVENCADAIVLAGLTPAIDGETFNIVDDELPTSRQFLRFYKKQVRRFGSVYLPKFAGYTLCALVEKYSYWSQGQLPPFLNRRMWHAVWKRTRYTNEKAKRLLKWNPAVRTGDGLERYFHACRETKSHA